MIGAKTAFGFVDILKSECIQNVVWYEDELENLCFLLNEDYFRIVYRDGREFKFQMKFSWDWMNYFQGIEFILDQGTDDPILNEMLGSLNAYYEGENLSCFFKYHSSLKEIEDKLCEVNNIIGCLDEKHDEEILSQIRSALNIKGK